MKVLRLILLSLLSWSSSMMTADTVVPNLKFGKPTDEEMRMTTYDKDPEAKAVVLCSLCDVEYNFAGSDFKIIYRVQKRIKVLKPEGVECANLSVQYYNQGTTTGREDVSISATSYNLVDGKVEKSKMKSNLIFDELIDEDLYQKKFTVPQVKEGTVIEYEYTLMSSFYHFINDWYPQEDIPVAYARYELTIPEYFTFNVENTGSTGQLKEQRIGETMTFSVKGESFQALANRYVFEGRDFAAIRKEKFTWNTRDYQTKVFAELRGIRFPGQLYKDYTNRWENVDETLLTHQDFGRRMNEKSPFRDELLGQQIDKMEDIHERVVKTILLLKSKLKWNGEYRMLAKSPASILKKGNGTNADLNAILINMLSDVNVKAFPIVMSTREHGILPISFPSIKKLNTFIVGIPLADDNKMLYVDMSAEDGYLNVLPATLYSNKARMIVKGGMSQWVDLQDIAQSTTSSVVRAEILPNGVLKGECVNMQKGIMAADMRKEFRTAKDSATFVSDVEKRNGISIASYQMEGQRAFSETVKETISFVKKGDATPDHIYINPFPFKPVRENPFTAVARQLPIEFPFKLKDVTSVVLTIPDGWEVEEIPQSVSISAANNGVAAVLVSSVEGNQVNIHFKVDVKRIFYGVEEYADLKMMFDVLSERSKDMVVLKKVQ